MEKLKMQTADIAERNVEILGQMFPNCLTETINADGKLVRAIDFDKLRQELACEVVEGAEERYQFTWPNKRNAIRLANSSIDKTLRPCREESVDFDNTENLYIEGDNLEVLKLLRENYLGKVKMIYIDPPYNTGNDFVYNDDFAQGKAEFEAQSGLFDEEGRRMADPMVQNTESNGRFHTDWLNMIYPRLKVAKDLLADDGVVFISMDDNEIENLKKVCDEVYGERNFIGQWNWFKSATPPNLSKKIKKNIEYIIAYQKGGNNDVFTGVKKSSSSDDPITKPQNTPKILKFAAGTLHIKLADGIYSKGVYGTDKYPNELLNDLVVENGTNKNEVSFRNRFIWVQDTLNEQIAAGTRMNLSKSLVISYKKAEYGAEVPPNFIDASVGVETTENAGSRLNEIFGGRKIFDYPKPTSLIRYLINFCVGKSDNTIILDFFSGSATTAHAVMQLNAEDGGNRKFIMVQLPEKTDEKSEAYKAGYKNICEIGKERIRRAGRKIKEENASKEGIERLDVGFRVLKLDESNMADVYYTPADTPIQTTLAFDALVDNIREGRTAEDLLFQVLPECNLPLSSKIEIREIHGKKVFVVEDGYLMACFDKDINEAVITAIAKEKPYYFVMCDRSIATDNVADNFDQIFNAYSKETVRRIL